MKIDKHISNLNLPIINVWLRNKDNLDGFGKKFAKYLFIIKYFQELFLNDARIVTEANSLTYEEHLSIICTSEND